MKLIKLTVRIFTVFCIIVTCFMVGYWIFKYLKNDDIISIEYIPTNEQENNMLPEITICIQHPFIDEKLQNISHDLDGEKYLQYLRGDMAMNDTYQGISYQQVTLNLDEYFKNLVIKWRNKKDISYGFVTDCTNLENCPFIAFRNNYNGVINNLFHKCYGLKLEAEYEKDIEDLTFGFDSSLEKMIEKVGVKYIMLNYPQQVLKNNNGIQNIWEIKDKTDALPLFKFSNLFQITSIDLLKRRSKPQKRCSDKWKKFDDMVRQRQISNIGCTAPYQEEFQSYPMCQTQEELKRSFYDGRALSMDFDPAPCQEIPNIGYKHTRVGTNASEFSSFPVREFPIYISFPDQIKVISQSQAVDIHSLIGNIGGYIGLFLGKVFICFIYIRHKLLQHIPCTKL